MKRFAKKNNADAKASLDHFSDEYPPLEPQYIKDPQPTGADAPNTSAVPETSPVSEATATPEAPAVPEPSDNPIPSVEPSTAEPEPPVDQAVPPTEVKAPKKEKKAHKRSSRKTNKENKTKRKGRFITPLIILLIILTIIGGCAWNIYYCRTHFDVNFYQYESMHVSSDVRIAVISDVHMREYGEDNADLIAAVKSLHPDLIISAGDLVTYGVANYDSMLSLCSQLAEIAPFYGIMGNHEDEKTYLEKDEEMREKFASTGMKLLINSGETLRIKNSTIELIGVSGGTEGFDLYGGKDFMEKLPENTGALRICVAHVPTLFKERLEKYDFDLGIAGHTHGGIVRLPVVGGLYSAEEGFLPDLDSGLFELENDATLFVSRGLGDSTKLPPRFNNTPELAVIDVRWY